MYRIIIFMLFGTRLLSQDALDPDSVAYSIDLDQYVITAQYEPTHYKKASHRVKIISKEEIKERGAVTLDQALVINPAIRIGYDPILGSTIRMRGISSNNVSILIDGVPVIGRLNGNVDLSQINLQNVERIEIVEGALSNIYGSNAAGGVINLITKKNQSSRYKAELGTQLESTGQQNFNTNLGYNVGDFTFNISGRYFNYDQFPVDSMRLVEEIPIEDDETILQSKYPFNPKKQIGIGSFVRYAISDESTLLCKYDFNEEDITDYGVIKRPQWNPYSEDRFYKTTRADYSLNFKKKWDNTFVDITSAYNSFNRTYDDKRFYIESSTFDSLLQSSDTTHFNTFFNRAIVSHTFTEKLKGTAGVNYSNESGTGERIIDRMNSDSTNAQFTEVAPFVQLNYKLSDHIDFTASGRYTMHSIYNDRFTPTFLFKYSIRDNWIFRLGYSQGYRSPSLKELYLEFIDINHHIIGNTDLSPEISHDLQLTVEYDTKRSIDFSLNLYHTTITDKIDLFQYETLKFQYENLNEYKVFGFQPEISVGFVKNINFSSSASFSYWSTNIDSENAPSYGSVFDLNNSLQYSLEKADIKIIANHRHIGKQPSYRLIEDEVRIYTVQGYDLIDLSVNKSFLNKRLFLTLGVKNLLNITDTSIIGSSSGGAHGSAGSNAVNIGRSGFVNLDYSFGQ